MKRRIRFACVVMLLAVGAPDELFAQRQLHWDALDVDARLDADGMLEVAERHTMVFSGDWNGGERVFNIRPRQKLHFLGMERIDAASGVAQPLQETNVRPDRVDEFVLTDSRTLRWRSRLPSDRPFANTRLTYVLRYRLSGILLTDGEQYRLDHDFAFPDRAGPIARFSLNLAVDPAWRPLSEVRERYTAGPLAPGRSFVLTIPLRYTGSEPPVAIDTRRPPEIVQAVSAIFGVFALGVLAFFARESKLGRFVPVDTAGIDTDWIEKQIVAYPAEVVGAAWDGSIGAPEVVALISRMAAEGKLESMAGSAHSMSLRLKVNRDTLEGHERALVDGLFFDGRTETSTAAVREHYKGKGFNPAQVITPQLDAVVKTVNPPGKARVSWLPSLVLFLAGAAMLATTASTMPEVREGAIVILFAFLFGSVLL